MTKKTTKPATVNYSSFKCPTCNNFDNYNKDNEEIYCNECGTIIETPHRYVAGIRIHTISDFQLQYEKEKQKERWEKICKKKLTSLETQQQ